MTKRELVAPHSEGFCGTAAVTRAQCRIATRQQVICTGVYRLTMTLHTLAHQERITKGLVGDVRGLTCRSQYM